MAGFERVANAALMCVDAVVGDGPGAAVNQKNR
jgi:hypothetical protein